MLRVMARDHKDKPTEDRSNGELALDRTDWAEDRTLLANERTYAGWMRTGMASVALGVGLNAVFEETEPTWLAKSVATIFFAIGLAIFWISMGKACATVARLDEHGANPVGSRNVRIIGWSMMAATVATGVVIWTL